MKELEIGETLTIRCVESKGNCSQCNECAFMEKAGCYDILCWKGDRKDGKNVHYEIVSEEDIEPMVGAAAKEAIQVTIDEAAEWLNQYGYFNTSADEEMFINGMKEKSGLR